MTERDQASCGRNDRDHFRWRTAARHHRPDQALHRHARARSCRFRRPRGEVHALLGQNGAGKSTLIKILAGVYPADAGEIRFDGRLVRPGGETLPIAFIHQDLGLVEWMTVAENVALLAGYPRGRAGLISWRQVRESALTRSPAWGAVSIPMRGSRRFRPPSARWSRSAGRSPSSPTSSSSTSRRRRCRRPMSSACSTRSAGSARERHRHHLRHPPARRGVPHRRPRDRAARRPPRRDGATSARPRRAISSRMIVGRSLTDAFVKPAPATERVVLEVEDAVAERGRAGLLHASRPARRLGLVGLRGAGHHTIGRRHLRRDAALGAGHVLLDGQSIDPADPADAMRQADRLRLEPARRGEHRRQHGGAREPLPEPGGDRQRRRSSSIGRARRARRQQGRARPLLGQAARSRAADRHALRRQPAEGGGGALDGGARCALLVLEEPTIGVDVGSKAEIYHLLQQSLRKGLAVLLISSDFEEVERICHRALVFSRGRVVGEIPRHELTIARLTASASGGADRRAPGSRT